MINNKIWIENQLKKLPYVRWDRFYRFGENLENPSGMVVFGWIERDKDSYKDFVALEFNILNKEVVCFTTSSRDKSEDIAKTFGFEHSNCERVEDNFKITNCVKLK